MNRNFGFSPRQIVSIALLSLSSYLQAADSELGENLLGNIPLSDTFQLENSLTSTPLDMNIDQDSDGLIDISTLEQLDWVRNNLAGTSLISHSGVEYHCQFVCTGYELVNDLSFDTNQDGVVDENDDYFDYEGDNSMRGWLPIGSEARGFSTVFHGNNHTIEGLYINRPEQSFVGLFARLESEGVAESNITVISDLFIETAEQGVIGKDNVGILTGNIHILQGGVITLKQMDVKGRLEGVRKLGGLAGSVTSTTDEGSASGLVTFRQNNVNLTAQGQNDIGGIVGSIYDSWFLGGNYHRYHLIDNETDVVLSGYSYLGGIVGYVLVEANEILLERNHSKAMVTGNTNIAGIVGQFNCGGGTDCQLTELTTNASLRNASRAGGIIGGLYTNTDSKLSNSRAIVNIRGENSVGGLVGELVAIVPPRGGNSESIVSNSSSVGFVSGVNSVGGLVGIAETITNNLDQSKLELTKVFSTARVIGQSQVGGLIGTVSTSPEVEGGGFIPRINNAYAAGVVRGDDNVGGLVGLYTVDPLSYGYFTGGSISNSYSVSFVQANTNEIDRIGQFIGAADFPLRKRFNYYQTNTATLPGIGAQFSDEDFPSSDPTPDELSGHLVSQLSCPEAPDNTDCASTDLYVGWDESIWDFGNSTQLPGLIINGRVQRPIVGIMPPPPPADVIFEAEDQELLGHAMVYSDESASEGAGVAYISAIGSGFRIANAPQARSISVVFASIMTGALSLKVNGEDHNVRFFSTGSWVNNYTTAIIDVEVPAGATVEMVYENGDVAMNVDQLIFHSMPMEEPFEVPDNFCPASHPLYSNTCNRCFTDEHQAASANCL
ncbi:hypothetical protein [Marinibactrum halimedae]|uniref:GLUG domain-containing protein n=1 Tax=Marinibactrum halimedae TaxID=1444977 RepID=A0AA37T1W5_9GAMM|nr:hypothetical protein [Marinibactrum halimedae]MCD9459592.1 hypothetical protein [Marinibactrum halimedae]GLS25590.1 hypothetical protein GCM10007877_13040 [Marinibactrum halimedae]